MLPVVVALALSQGQTHPILSTYTSAPFLAAKDSHDANCACGAFLPEYDENSAILATQDMAAWPSNAPVADVPGERHLANVRQLTFGGQNAEAYWSKDGKKITYQTRQPGYPDEQIFVMNADGSEKRLVSTGKGRCTCSYFSPDQKWIYFSSTHERNEGAQKALDMSKGYLWMVNPDFSLYRVRAADALGKSGKKPVFESVIKLAGYVAETTIAPNGKFMTFTAKLNDDLNVYRADINGGNWKQLTDEIGYDGGPFVSWDSKKIVWRRDATYNASDKSDYQNLLKENLVRPSRLEIWIMDADGKNKKQVTHLNCASFAPFLHPNGKQIIFSSNYGDPKGREFDLWVINVDGSGLQQITKSPEFDGFPMFTRDGKHLVFGSNRNGKVRGETNVFVADWKQ